MDARKIGPLVLGALVALVPAMSSAARPDICEDVVLGPTGQPYTDLNGLTISKWCEPHTDPPVLDADICCVIMDEANCVMPDEVGRCSIGMKFSCLYGEQVGEGVACYQQAPSACGMGFCGGEYDAGATECESTSWLCCTTDDGVNGDCVHAGETQSGDIPPASAVCNGYLAACNWGFTNLDGTVTCLG